MLTNSVLVYLTYLCVLFFFHSKYPISQSRMFSLNNITNSCDDWKQHCSLFDMLSYFTLMFSLISEKRTHFQGNCHNVFYLPLEKWFTQKKKKKEEKAPPPRANYFLLEKTPFQKGLMCKQNNNIKSQALFPFFLKKKKKKEAIQIIPTHYENTPI